MDDESTVEERIETPEALERRLHAVLIAAEAGGLDVRGAYMCSARDSIYDIEVTRVVPPTK